MTHHSDLKDAQTIIAEEATAEEMYRKLDQALAHVPVRDKAEIAATRRANALRKQMVIDERLAKHGIAAGRVKTWRDCEWLQTEASFRPRRRGPALLAALARYKAGAKR
jgi:hypothetical protein